MGHIFGSSPRPDSDGATGIGITANDLGSTLAAIAEPDLFGHRADPALPSIRAAYRRRLVRLRRRDAAVILLAEPWTAWDATAGEPEARRLARRFLRRHPDRDRVDPDARPLSDREDAAAYHAEEEALEEGFRRMCL